MYQVGREYLVIADRDPINLLYHGLDGARVTIVALHGDMSYASVTVDGDYRRNVPLCELQLLPAVDLDWRIKK